MLNSDFDDANGFYKNSSSDENAVVDLWLKCQLVVPWNNPRKDIARKLKVNPELFLVGTLAGKVIASVMGGYEGHRGWINYLAVDPACQRQNIGIRMAEAVEHRLRSMGCPKICLQVRLSNQVAISFYESIGYRNDQVVGLGKRLARDEEFKNIPPEEE